MLLICAKTIVKESRKFELDCLKKKKKKKRDFEKFVCISIYCVSALSLHIESTDSMIHMKRGACPV